MKKVKSLIVGASLAVLSAAGANAAIIVNLPTASTPGSISITNDITFTSLIDDRFRYLVFDEWVASDGIQNDFTIAAFSPSTMQYELNGMLDILSLSSTLSFVDNQTNTVADITPNDGRLSTAVGVDLVVGDVFTIKAQTWVLAANSMPAGFNPQTNQAFTGGVFLLSSFVDRMSDNVSAGPVPEPTQTILLIAGLGMVGFRRRRTA